MFAAMVKLPVVRWEEISRPFSRPLLSNRRQNKTLDLASPKRPSAPVALGYFTLNRIESR